jgi:glycosyltransferase involved in cell wall biosynthesis
MGDGTDPLVSVVVPTYDRPDLLAEAVESVADQTYSPLELVVVDDRSPVPAAETLESVDTSTLAHVECLRHQENRGANAARTTGIEAARGRYIAFLDDDDRWTMPVVSRYVEAFEVGGERVGLVCTGVRIVDESGDQIGSHLPRIHDDALETLLDGALIGSFSRFAVRSSVVAHAGLPDERLPSWQDWEWQFRLARYCDFAAVPELLVIRTEGGHDQLSDDFTERRDVAYPLILERHRESVAANGPRAEARFVALLSRTLGFAALRTGHYRSAFRYLFRALRYDPTALETYFYLALASGGPVTHGVARRAKRALSGSRP